jgi:SPP1 gp7 family putative phage head morphogenesis protein
VEALLKLFRLAEALVERELLGALATDAKSTARQRNQRLSEIRAILTELRSKAVGTDTSPGLAWQVVADGYREGSRRADKATPEGASTSLGGIFLDSARALYEALVGNLDAAILHVERSAQRTLRKAALQEVLVGQLAGRSDSQTSQALAENLRRHGIRAFTDSRGREWSLSRYTEMVVRTTVTEASTTAGLLRFAENGMDLVKWNAGAGEKTCSICRPFDGKVYSISGTSDEHPALDIAPPVHPNCRCVLTAFVEGLNVVKSA